MRLSTATLTIFCCLSLFHSATAPAQFYPQGHELEGLPDTKFSVNAYDDDPANPLNRLHQLLFLESLVPAEVQQQLPSQRTRLGKTDEEFYVTGWYFQKEKGTERDRQTFGGDVRVSPRHAFNNTEREQLLELLGAVRDWHSHESMKTLNQPLVRLMLQWDLLSVWWQLERSHSTDTPLLVAMAQGIESLAQDATVLKRLPNGLDELIKQYPMNDELSTAEPYLPHDLAAVLTAESSSNWTEVGRRSTQLFNAQRSLRVSKAYFNTGSQASNMEVLKAVEQKPKGEVDVADGTQTLLVMQLIGLDNELNPVATPVIDELRVRIATGEAVLSSSSKSSSHDGSSHWIYMRTRFGTRQATTAQFRFVPDTAQSLFVEYGTKKHATYAAQCALCHRRTNDGGQAPAGIRMFSQVARPHVALPQEREQLAVNEMSLVVEKLRSRLTAAKSERTAGADEQESASGRRPARAERTTTERASWIEQLRRDYHQPSQQWPKPHVDSEVVWSELGTLPEVKHPPGNAFSADKKKLGEMLFFDPRLSGSQQLACASCHDPDLGWADGKTLSFGHSRTMLSRNTPTIRNAGHWERLFWDGRAGSLEEQVLHVLSNPSEMRANEVDVVAKLREHVEYQSLFELSFGDPTVTLERIAKAIACYERTVVGGQSRFDAFAKGKYDALSDTELVGLDLFRREARCINCHHGPLFSDNRFHDVGLSYYGRKFEDLGLYTVTQNPADVGKFRTPSLRDIARTAPLMHNGLFELPGVLNMYNAGMPTLRPKADELYDPKFPIKSVHLKPLQLNRADLKDLESFLLSLEEPKRRVWPPPLPGLERPKLGTRPQ